MHDPSSHPSRNHLRSWALIAAVAGIILLAFGYVGGWLAPGRLTPAKMVNQLQADNGTFPTFRRNHAKGMCITGYFQSSGQAQPFSNAQVFASGRTPVVGRFALASGNPYAPDDSVPIRSMALRFTQANGQQWRTGMLDIPAFLVNTPQAFYELLQAQQPDPKTGKPDPAKLGAFFGSHPETGPFLAWVKTAKPLPSYVPDTYGSMNAFVFVGPDGVRHPVRWRMVPETADTGGEPAKAGDPNYLAADLLQRMAQGPLRWHLLVTLAEPGDPTNDATKAWPDSRRTVDAGMLVIEHAESQENGPCRDINYDPTVLPAGIELSDDPLLPARSAVYATSYLRRTSEEAQLPGTAAARPQAEAQP
jgi:catalase